MLSMQCTTGIALTTQKQQKGRKQQAWPLYTVRGFAQPDATELTHLALEPGGEVSLQASSKPWASFRQQSSLNDGQEGAQGRRRFQSGLRVIPWMIKLKQQTKKREGERKREEARKERQTDRQSIRRRNPSNICKERGLDV